jgi:hypothetical protein
VKNALKYKEQFFSLNYIKDLLLYFSINSKCYKLSPDILPQLEYPFVVQIRSMERDEFVVLTSISEQRVLFYDSFRKKNNIPLKDFESLFTGYVILPFPDEYSGDPDYEDNIQKEKRDRWTMYSVLTGIVACILVLIFQMLFHHKPILTFWIPFFFLKATALIPVSQILKIELGESNGLIRKVCKTSHCAEVLTSKASRIFSWLSMGDVGAIYFGSGVFILSIAPFLDNPLPAVSLLLLLNLCALPYTLLSVSYQYFVVKSWCPFCLSVMGILWMEFFFRTDFAMAYAPPACFGLNCLFVWFCRNSSSFYLDISKKIIHRFY